MRFQKSLLRGVQISIMEGRSARHAAHRKDLQLDPFSGQIGIRLVPIDLCFHAPGIALWNTSLTFQEAQHNLAIVHILANGEVDPKNWTRC